MNLLELSKASKKMRANHSILIYGPPKVGKTRLVGTAARLKEINRIFLFDLDNGSETLLHMGLADEELTKITIFKIRDTRDNPIGIETMLKVMTTKGSIRICDLHGRVNCTPCIGKRESFTDWDLTKCTHNDLVVIDSGSALADSALAATCMGQDTMFKPGWDEYAISGKWLIDILSVIQQCQHTNFMMLTHELLIEDENKRDTFCPLVGTRAFSLKVAKYFGTVIYADKKAGKHVAGSSSTYRNNVMTGSRLNALIEDEKIPDIRAILIKGGVLKELKEGEVIEEIKAVENSSTTQAIDVLKEAAPTGLAAMLAKKKATAQAKRDAEALVTNT